MESPREALHGDSLLATGEMMLVIDMLLSQADGFPGEWVRHVSLGTATPGQEQPVQPGPGAVPVLCRQISRGKWGGAPTEAKPNGKNVGEG